MVPLTPRNRLIKEVNEAELLKSILPRLGAAAANTRMVPADVGGGHGRKESIWNEAFRTAIGPGDDAALVYFRDGYTFISTDTLVEDYDFRRVWPCGYATSGFDPGWKAVTQNVADISAMGAVATAMTLSLSLPRDLELSWVENFADGVRQASEYFSAQLGQAITVVGGDLNAADRISATVTILGIPLKTDTAPLSVVIGRDGAQAGDIIAVSQGSFPLGAAHVALGYLESEDGERAAELFRPQLRPAPDFGIVFNAAEAHAMIDTSDGLVHELEALLKSSGSRSASVLQAKLDDRALAAMAEELARHMGCDFDTAIAAVLSGGEDHLLVACFAAGADLPLSFTPIGTVVRGRDGTEEGARPVISEYLSHATVFDHFYRG